jgi:hypothetical protein
MYIAARSADSKIQTLPPDSQQQMQASSQHNTEMCKLKLISATYSLHQYHMHLSVTCLFCSQVETDVGIYCSNLRAKKANTYLNMC